MSDDVVDPRDAFDPETALVTMSLDALGEVAATVAKAWAEYRGVEAPRMVDEDGVITDDGRVIAQAAWHSIMHQYDRNEFIRSMQTDLAALSTEPVPEHRPEFGL